MENNDYIKQIEINGIKVEVDLRTCKTIAQIRQHQGLKRVNDNYCLALSLTSWHSESALLL